jgi:ABC-type sugar transport system substrate-binding protein
MMIVGFGTSGGIASAQRAHASKGTIAFLLSGPDLYYKYGSDGAKAAAAKLGYKLQIYSNSTTSATQEATNVQNAVTSGAVAITGYSVAIGTEGTSIQYAAKHHVPMFWMYGYSHPYLNNKYVVGFEQVNLAKYAVPDGKYVKSHVKKGQVAVITGALGRGDAEGYQQGFLQGLGCSHVAIFPAKQNFPLHCGKITVVTSQTGNWVSSGTPGKPGGKEAAAAIITAYPKLKALYVENEEMWLGVRTALKSAGKMKQVMQLSTNGSPYGLAGIKAGELRASNTDSPYQESLYAVRFIDNYLHHHGAHGHLYYSKTVFVTKANVKKAVGWSPNHATFLKLMKDPLPKPVKHPPM